MPFNPKSHSLCWEALSMCYGTVSTFWQVVYKTALAFASHFCSISRTENRAISDLSWPCAWPHVCSWFSRVPGIIGTFQRSYGHLISHYFLLSLLVSVLFAPTVITASGSWYVKHLLLTVFDKCPGENTIHIDCILVHDKYRQALRAGVSRELSNRSVQFSSVQSLSLVRLFVTPWIAARQASLSTNSWSLLKLMSIESVMPSNQLILCCPLRLLPLIFPSIKVFSNESVLHIRWPKYWSFSFNISPSNEGTTVQKHQFFGTQLSLWYNSHIHTWLLVKT